jgi:hypothetical protein
VLKELDPYQLVPELVGQITRGEKDGKDRSPGHCGQ